MTAVAETVGHGRAKAHIAHYRPKAWRLEGGELVPDYRWIDGPFGPVIDPKSAELVGEETVHNVITNAGRDFLHQQGYATSGLGANGLNYIALSNRAQGTVTHTGGTNTTTVQKTFTASGSQAAQKAALFTAAAAGTMNHALRGDRRARRDLDPGRGDRRVAGARRRPGRERRPDGAARGPARGDRRRR